MTLNVEQFCKKLSLFWSRNISFNSVLSGSWLTHRLFFSDLYLKGNKGWRIYKYRAYNSICALQSILLKQTLHRYKIMRGPGFLVILNSYSINCPFDWNQKTGNCWQSWYDVWFETHSLNPEFSFSTLTFSIICLSLLCITGGQSHSWSVSKILVKSQHWVPVVANFQDTQFTYHKMHFHGTVDLKKVGLWTCFLLQEPQETENVV